MSDADRIIVQETYGKILRFSKQAAVLFYARLFEIDPSIMRLFHGDMRDQARALIATLTFAVDGLGELPTLLPAVEDVGRGYARAGMSPSDYDAAGAALLWMLEAMLGPDFTNEVEAAWSNVYALLADTMCQAAEASAA